MSGLCNIRGALNRRDFLQSSGCGFGSLALAGLCAEAAAREAPLSERPPHHRPRAKRVIFLFMYGGPSQVDSFDYKPQLDKDHEKAVPNQKNTMFVKSPWKFDRYGECGLPVSELFPNIARHADDLCVLNSLHTDSADHFLATIQMHTGNFQFARPSVGSWVTYGLGTENQNLPGFITISPNPAGGGAGNHSSVFLPAPFAGTPVGAVGQPLEEASMPNVTNPYMTVTQQRRQLDLLQALHHERLARDGMNDPLEGVIESYELAFRMQSEVPHLLDLSGETKSTLEAYGIDTKETDSFGRQCLMARRFAEAGVRYIQLNHSFWDHHTEIVKGMERDSKATDQPIGALLADLKQRGLLDDTLVLWGGEFGRPPWPEKQKELGKLEENWGRNHNHQGFTMWIAGGGSKPGLRYGATDEHGYRAVENKIHLHDLHATLLHFLGLDHERLTYRYSGRDFRLTDVHGHVVTDIMA